jgi:hypothetical protein
MKILIILVAFILVSSLSTTFSQEIDACSLLKKSEVESAIGRSVLEPLKDAGKMGEIRFSHCTYKKNADLVGVLLTVYTYKSKDEVKKLFESSMKEAGDTEPVSGLGDGAYWWKSKTTFFVVKGKYMISLFLGSDAGGLAAAKNMAEKAVKGLP